MSIKHILIETMTSGPMIGLAGAAGAIAAIVYALNLLTTAVGL